ATRPLAVHEDRSIRGASTQFAVATFVRLPAPACRPVVMHVEALSPTHRTTGPTSEDPRRLHRAHAFSNSSARRRWPNAPAAGFVVPARGSDRPTRYPAGGERG